MVGVVALLVMWLLVLLVDEQFWFVGFFLIIDCVVVGVYLYFGLVVCLVDMLVVFD